MQKQDLEAIFSELKEYAGEALKLHRLSNMWDPKKFATLLKINHSWPEIPDLSEKTITEMENGKINISFSQVQRACKVLKISMKDFLQTMVLKKSHEDMSETEAIILLRDAIKQTLQELDYQEWKKDKT